MHENAARALQYYEDLPRRSGRPELRLVDADPKPRRRERAVHADVAAEPHIGGVPRPDTRRAAERREAQRREARVREARLRPTRRQPVAPRIAGRPDRVAMWAVLLGFFLTAVAAASGHA
jgi:hypothetical protein